MTSSQVASFSRVRRRRRIEARSHIFGTQAGLLVLIVCGTIFLGGRSGLPSTDQVAFTTARPDSDSLPSYRRLSGGNGTNHDTGVCSHFKDPSASMKPLVILGDVVGILYVFLGLAIICDDCFQPSLEKISDELGLSPDVAGATFLAAGSSAPELFTSMSDNVIQPLQTGGVAASIGLGTIVGSAMFNILVIVAAAAFVAGSGGNSLNIDYRPVIRDASFYCLSIIMLALFMMIISPGDIEWWEALVMVLGYVVYILFMMNNEGFLAKLPLPGFMKDEYSMKPKSADQAAADKAALESAAASIETADAAAGGSARVATVGVDAPGSSEPEKAEEEDEVHTYASNFEKPEEGGALAIFMWALVMPYKVLFTLLIPDYQNPWGVGKLSARGVFGDKIYWAQFCMSILLIGALCEGMVHLAIEFGCICKVEAVIMGVLVLSIGTSVPDAIGSIIAARDGEADMAIANAIGSNVFDVLLGLGFPWLLANAIFNAPSTVDKKGLIPLLILFGTVLLFFGVLVANKWKMTTHVGAGLLALYGVYVIYTFIVGVILS